jgi:hypothetical protein
LEPDLTSGIGRNRRRLDHTILYGTSSAPTTNFVTQ